jgi:hypothetical protein
VLRKMDIKIITKLASVEKRDFFIRSQVSVATLKDYTVEFKKEKRKE